MTRQREVSKWGHKKITGKQPVDQQITKKGSWHELMILKRQIEKLPKLGCVSLTPNGLAKTLLAMHSFSSFSLQ